VAASRTSCTKLPFALHAGISRWSSSRSCSASSAKVSICLQFPLQILRAARQSALHVGFILDTDLFFERKTEELVAQKLSDLRAGVRVFGSFQQLGGGRIEAFYHGECSCCICVYLLWQLVSCVPIQYLTCC